jgi:hypothetical protein
VAIASAVDGRVRRRLEKTRGRVITRLAASADGQRLYFASEGSIWTISTADGEARRLCPGEAVTVDPADRFILIQRHERDAVHIVRREANGRETRLDFPPGISATRSSLWPGALHRDGRLLVVVEPRNSWFWGPVIVDVNTGRVARVPVAYAGDIEVDLAWDGDRIVGLARRMESALWRFTRTK